jgi:hypothetical protein
VGNSVFAVNFCPLSASTGKRNEMFFWHSKRSKKQEYVDIVGDYNPSDARIEELVGIYTSVRSKIDYSNSILRMLEGTSSYDMIGDQTTKVKELIVKCYAELERLNLEGNPFDSLENQHEHTVYAKCASLIIPVLIKLGAHEEAKDLFAEIKIDKIRDELLFKHFQLRIPKTTP